MLLLTYELFWIIINDYLVIKFYVFKTNKGPYVEIFSISYEWQKLCTDRIVRDGKVF